jgi:hypothetical protein
MNAPSVYASPYSCQPQTIAEIRWKRTYATTLKQCQNMSLQEQAAEMSENMFTIVPQNKDQSAKRLVTKKLVRFNLEANVTMFYNNDPRSSKMGLAKWSSKRKDLSRWGATPTDKGLPMSGRNCNIHFITDTGAKRKTSKKCVRFNLDVNVTMFCNNELPRSTKMGLAKWSSQRKNLNRWGDDTTETTEISGSIPRLPRRGSGNGSLDKARTNNAEGLVELPEAASRAATAAE